MLRQYRNRPFLFCHICGDVARGYNFDVITCLSCKAFFRRNAFRSPMMHRCHYRHCTITKETRGNCPACRLTKCFLFGMNRNLIQTNAYRTLKTNPIDQSTPINQNSFHLPTPRPLNLLQNDCSSLTQEHWSLLSNIIRSYDARSIITEVKQFLNEKSSLPAKLRLKTVDIITFMNKPLDNMIPLLERSPHFLSLSNNAHRAVILHNLFFSGCLNGYLIARETNQFENAAYMTASGTLYGFDYMQKCAKDNERLEINGNLIKVMLFILIFSSNCSMVVFDGQENLGTMTNTTELIHIQDIYVTMLWKYLIHIYGYHQAIQRFSLMVKTVLDMLSRVEELSDNMSLRKTIDQMVIHTETALNITEYMT